MRETENNEYCQNHDYERILSYIFGGFGIIVLISFISTLLPISIEFYGALSLVIITFYAIICEIHYNTIKVKEYLLRRRRI